MRSILLFLAVSAILGLRGHRTLTQFSGRMVFLSALVVSLLIFSRRI